MISFTPEMLSELIETLAAAGVGLDRMDWAEDRMRAAEYQHMAAFCSRMLAVIPKNQPGLAELLSTHTSLQEIWSALHEGKDITRGASWTLGSRLIVADARHPEKLGDCAEARSQLRRVRRSLR